MCLGIPARVTDTGDSTSPMPMGTIDMAGEIRPCCLAYVPEVQVGDFVLVQRGFAMDIIDADDAAESLNTIDEFGLISSNNAGR